MSGGSDELRNAPHIVLRTADRAVASPRGFKEVAIRATCNQQICCRFTPSSPTSTSSPTALTRSSRARGPPARSADVAHAVQPFFIPKGSIRDVDNSKPDHLCKRAFQEIPKATSRHHAAVPQVMTAHSLAGSYHFRIRMIWQCRETRLWI
jgi:hypothetical protein